VAALLARADDGQVERVAVDRYALGDRSRWHSLFLVPTTSSGGCGKKLRSAAASADDHVSGLNGRPGEFSKTPWKWSRGVRRLAPGATSGHVCERIRGAVQMRENRCPGSGKSPMRVLLEAQRVLLGDHFAVHQGRAICAVCCAEVGAHHNGRCHGALKRQGFCRRNV
jgi:hypothetical protein